MQLQSSFERRDGHFVRTSFAKGAHRPPTAAAAAAPLPNGIPSSSSSPARAGLLLQPISVADLYMEKIGIQSQLGVYFTLRGKIKVKLH